MRTRRPLLCSIAMAVFCAMMLPIATSAGEGTVPTVADLLGSWDWVSTYHPWTNETDTPETMGYAQSIRIAWCGSTTLCVDWFRDGEPICCTSSVELPSDDESQEVDNLGFGSTRLTNDQLIFDATPYDGDRHTFTPTAVSTGTMSWSAVKALF